MVLPMAVAVGFVFLGASSAARLRKSFGPR